ncbi:MAG: hypothetical protein D0528_01295 [Methylococcales bacterium]|nr:MAG: hypothetical protein D0528_01295 [Methylococcales bacterium]
MPKPDDTEILIDEFSNDDYDSPWKDAVEHYFPELMAFYFPMAYAEIDWSKIFQEIESIERREDMRYINSVQRMYMEKFRAEGVLTGEVKVLKRQLEKRFGSLPTWAIDKLENAAEQELDIWSESILTAETLNAVFDTDTTH